MYSVLLYVFNNNSSQGRAFWYIKEYTDKRHLWNLKYSSVQCEFVLLTQKFRIIADVDYAHLHLWYCISAWQQNWLWMHLGIFLLFFVNGFMATNAHADIWKCAYSGACILHTKAQTYSTHTAASCSGSGEVLVRSKQSSCQASLNWSPTHTHTHIHTSLW